MKIVTVAEVDFFRLGSADGRSAFGSHRQLTQFRVVPNDQPETLRALIVALAVEGGEQAQDLAGLKAVSGYLYSAPPGVLVFDVEHRGVQYSQAYAACRSFTALESEGRYFRLDEVII